MKHFHELPKNEEDEIEVDWFSIVSIHICKHLKQVMNKVTLFNIFKMVDNLYRYQKALHIWTPDPYAMAEAI